MWLPESAKEMIQNLSPLPRVSVKIEQAQKRE